MLASSRLGVILYSKPLHPVTELTESDTEELGRRRAVEGGLAERLEDRFALDAVELIRQGPGIRRAVLLGPRWGAKVQVFYSDFGASRESERSLKDVLQLADIAGKVVALELVQRLWREPSRRGPGLRGKPLEDGGGDEADIVAALPQRRHGELDDVEPVEEVLAEAAGGDELGELLVRSANDAHVDRVLLRRADLANAFLLDGAQQLHLHGERQVRDLVEEERAAVCCLEESVAVLRRPGEGALLVAEEFALHQVLGDGAAVDRHERPLAPRAVLVDQAGRQLLAGARFTRDV